MNKQRETVYALRKRILAKEGLREYLFETAGDILDGLLDQYAGGEGGHGEWDLEGLQGRAAQRLRRGHGPSSAWTLTEISREELRDTIEAAYTPSTRPRSSAWLPSSCASTSAWSCSRSSTTSGRTTS